MDGKRKFLPISPVYTVTGFRESLKIHRRGRGYTGTCFFLKKKEVGILDYRECTSTLYGSLIPTYIKYHDIIAPFSGISGVDDRVERDCHEAALT